jgi:hypothetical protein
MKVGLYWRNPSAPICRGGCSYRIQAAALGCLDEETLRVLRQPKGWKLTSSDLRPFEARITTTRKGQRHRAHYMFAQLELCAIASTTKAMGMLGLPKSDVPALKKKDTAVTRPAEVLRRLRAS